MPEMDLDRKSPLNGTMAAYAQQMLISTGKDDWTSRIEDEDDAGFIKGLKGLLGRGGQFSDPFHNVMLTNSSFPPSTPPASSTTTMTTASAYLFPSFRYIPSIPLSPPSIQAFTQGFLLPRQLHSAHDTLPHSTREMLQQKRHHRAQFAGVRDVKEVVVLICGHGGRDQRCGIMGPLLRAEFETALRRSGFDTLRDAHPMAAPADPEASSSNPQARVGLISHIGGHKFAGNVIIYIPPSFKDHGEKDTTLAGTGIWYGRVEPRHVEGIVEQTVMKGIVIEELFRGGVGKGGRVFRI
ncbi:MAG: hypothetical protein M1819_006830 [Sarea resinae]|nr:MAG: hypothetical protein M1819_006830 [Sarea resinae]